MPITQSAKKALRQNVRRRIRNLKRNESYKQAIKTVRKFAAAKRIEEAITALPRAQQTLDKAARMRTITANKASRLKSRLAQLIKRSTSASS